MIWQIIKKQGLVLWRNPMQLLLLVGLPIILIAILGTALGGVMSGGSPNINVKVVFIEHEDEVEQVNRFVDEMEGKISPEVLEGIQSNKKDSMPVSVLKETVFGSEEVKEFVEFKEVHPSEREEILKDDTYTAIIEVPENFTYEMLIYMMFEEGHQPALKVFQNESHPIGASILNGILTQFQDQLTLGKFLDKKEIDQSIFSNVQGVNLGEKVTINQKDSVTTKGYYAVGMAVMNVLFVASAIGSIAVLEKKIHVFDRVILANVSRWIYFIAICISGAIFGFIHLLIVYGFAWLFFGVSWPNLLAFFTITLAYAVAIGGITVLLTALSYRFNSEIMTSFFAGIVVTIMSVLGGSFFPIGDSSAFIQKLGNLTPNGAGMSAYLSVLRGDGIAEISGHIFSLIIFALVAIVVAALSFPKRGAKA